MRGVPPGLRERGRAAFGASWTAGLPWARRAAVTVLASLFLAVSGAFGSAAVPFRSRFLFWVLGIAIGSAIGGFIADTSDRRGWPRGARAHFLFIAFATAVPTTLAIWLLDGWFFAAGHLDLRLLGELAVPVLVITFAMTAVNALADRQPVMTHAAPTAEAARKVAERARLLDRLPGRLKGAELLAIEAEDHYLRLHTSRGSDLILLRLADAMAELEGIEGAQTHRSWWVAREAVQGARRAEGRATLLLKGGVEAPVSRTYAKALRDAAWF